LPVTFLFHLFRMTKLFRVYRGFIVLILLSLLINIPIQSQTQNYNNLQHKLSSATDSLEKVYIYHSLVNELKNDSLELAIKYNKKALKLANNIKSSNACGATNELMGELYNKNNNIQPAINYYLISAKIYEELDNLKKLSSIYGNLGLLYYTNNFDTERTLFYYQKSLDYAVQLDDDELIGEAYNRIGGIFFNQRNLDDALYYFNRSYKIYSNLKNTRGEAIALNNIGEVYRLKGDFTEALSYYKESVELNTKANYIRLKAINYENIGQIYSIKGEINKSLMHYNISLDLYKNINDIVSITSIHILIANEYLKINNIIKANYSFNKAYELALNNNLWEEIAQASLGLSKIFESKKEYKKSLQFVRIYSQYNDSIIKKQMQNELISMQSHFSRSIKEKEIQIKDSEIEILENENEINKLKQKILILGVIVLIILVLLTLLRLRFKVKKERIININDRKLHEAQKELLNVEIRSKDNDLINFALHLVQKNKVLQQLKTDLNNLSSNENDVLNRKLKELSIHVKQSLQINKDIEEFQEKVDITNNDFFNKLKIQFPTLTNNEKRLCALLRLNLSTKEIASLNNTSIKAVEMSRYRLRMKCKLKNKQSLSEYLHNI